MWWSCIPKNPAQHYADMLMLEKHEDMNPAFLILLPERRKI
jgi:hypothetical protein